SQLLVAAWQPLVDKSLLTEAEIVQRQLQGVGHRLQASVYILSHDMYLQYLLFVMHLQGLEIRAHKVAPVLVQMNCHCRTKYRQALVQANDVHFVQPQQRTIEQLAGIFYFGFQHDVLLERDQKFSQRAFRQLIDATRSGGQSSKQMLQQELRGSSSKLRRFVQSLPLALQGDMQGFIAGAPGRDTADTAGF